jgi:hypothetical protein
MSRNLHRDEIAKTRPGSSEIFLTTPSAPSSERSLFLTRRSHPSSGGGESQRLRRFRCVFNSLHWILLAVLAFAPTAVLAQQAQPQAQTEKPQVTTEELKKEDAQKQTEEAQPKTEEDSKLKSVPGGKALGMSILGNQEAPKALVIVPWKSSELGNGPSVSTLLDDSRLPVDKEVFMRMLSYYEIRTESARPSGAPTNANATAPATPAPRRKP